MASASPAAVPSQHPRPGSAQLLAWDGEGELELFTLVLTSACWGLRANYASSLLCQKQLSVAKCEIQLQEFNLDVIVCRQEVFRVTGKARGLLGTFSHLRQIRWNSTYCTLFLLGKTCFSS